MIHRMGRHVQDAILGAVLAFAAALMLMTPMVVESPFFPSNGLPFSVRHLPPLPRVK